MTFLVSICIPTYNGAKYLKECLDSVLTQTFTDFELLIIDDKSSDDTVSIAQEYAAYDSRIRVIVNERNLGLVGNWNRCVELAQGEWIKFVFQDDLIDPQCLEKMLAASNLGIPIIFCRRQFIFENNTTEELQRYHLSTLSLVEKLFPGLTEISANDYCQAILTQIQTNRVEVNFVGEPVAVMLHQSAFRQFGIFNPYLIQYCDMEFWNRVAIHTGIVYVPETLATFRVHNKSTSAANVNSNKYRGWVLDNLILIHDFAIHPTYAPLRTFTSHQPSLNWINLLANKAYNARRIAERAATNSAKPDSSLLAEWKKVLELYPILFSLSQRSFVKRIIIHTLYRFKQIKQQMKALNKAQFQKKMDAS